MDRAIARTDDPAVGAEQAQALVIKGKAREGKGREEEE